MRRASFPPSPGLCSFRRLALALSPVCLLLLVGCAQTRPGTYANLPAVIRAQSAPELPPPGVDVGMPVSPPVIHTPGAQGTLPTMLPDPPPAEPPHPLPINLDTV